MKKFIEVGLVLVLLLLTGSAVLGQTQLTFQTGDVFAGIGNGQIQVYRPTPTEIGVVYTLVATLTGPATNTYDTGMAFDAAGNLYATDFSIGEVAKFDIHGNSSLFAGAFGAVSPESLAFDNAGNLFVGDANGFASDVGPQAHIWKLDSTGHLLTSFTVTAESRGADWVDLAADQHTLLYTSEGHMIMRFDTSTNTQLAPFATGLPGSNAFALRILPSGNVLVADSSAVVQVNTLGNVVQTYTPPNSGGAIFSLSLDPDGVHFWTGDSNTGTIWQVNIATGSVDQTISTGVSPTNPPAGLFGVAVYHEQTSSNTVNLQFTSTSTTQIATIGTQPYATDPAAQSLALTLASVTPGTTVNVSVQFFYEPTEFSTGAPGVGVADGECEPGATDLTDFDCRLLPFVYPQATLPDGGRLVPHIIPSHNLLGVWVRVIATLPDGSPAISPRDYMGPVLWYYAINTNPLLVGGHVNPEYPAGWNNMNLQMYDRPGTIIVNGQVVTNPDIDFVNNITTYFKNCDPNCVGNADPGSGGKTPTLNDIVVAAPANPPAGTPANTVELLLPVPSISPFPYFKGLPMLVAFKLENESKETSISNALTPPNTVSVATFQTSLTGGIGNSIPVQIPRGFPSTFTYNAFLKTYYIFLSPAPYTPGTKYILQINSALFPAPVNATFVVRRDE